MTYRLTLFPSHNNSESTGSEDLTWEEVVSRLSNHVVTPNKFSVGGFVPAYFVTGETRRLKQSAEAVSLAVFDADEPQDREHVSRCIDKLTSAGIAHHWYTTHSYQPVVHESWRLIIPLAKPCEVSLWTKLRRHLIQQFAIPSRVDKCSGPNHFYFFPSRRPDGLFEVKTYPGSPFTLPSDWVLPTRGRQRPGTPKDADASFDLPPEAPLSLDALKNLRETMMAEAARLLASKGDGYAQQLQRERGSRMINILLGQPPTEPGKRQDAYTSVIQAMVWKAPSGTPVSHFVELMRESLEAIQAEGSWWTETQLEDRIISAMKKRHASEAVNREADARLEELRTRFNEREKKLMEGGVQ